MDTGEDRNTERLSATRARLLDAVIESLAECGYAATSTTEIARRSGLTRGAQLHHFGTKGPMMVAAVDRLNERSNADVVARALDALPDEDRVHVTLQVLATLVDSTEPQAYAELWAAARGLPELANALSANDEIARASVRSLFGDQILERAGRRFDELLDLVMYALRGMAVDAYLVSSEVAQIRKEMIISMAPVLEEALEP